MQSELSIDENGTIQDETATVQREIRDAQPVEPDAEIRSYWNQGTDYVRNSTALMFLVTEAAAVVWLMVLALSAK